MFVVVSPAKKMKAQPLKHTSVTDPHFSVQTKDLVTVMKTKSIEDLQQLMKVSEKIATLNVERFSSFDTSPSAEGQPAAGLFAGDTYVGLDAATLTKEDLEYAQKHFGILSGLYGLLSPMDAIQPYRLEMGTRLKTDKGSNLYQFWGQQVTDALAEKLVGSKYLINCASNEYFSVLDAQRLKQEYGISVITPVFKEIDKKNATGKMKIISFNAKRARGMMARYIIRRRLDSPSAIQEFAESGYTFRSDLSSEQEYVFVR